MYLWNSLLQLAWIYFSYLLRSTLLKASLFQASFLSETYHHGNCYIVKSLSQDPAGTITADLRQCWSLTVKNQQASSLQISDNADLWHYTLVGRQSAAPMSARYPGHRHRPSKCLLPLRGVYDNLRRFHLHQGSRHCKPHGPGVSEKWNASLRL